MIRVVVEDYCQLCLDFIPDVTYPARSLLDNGIVIQSDTTIHCKHRRRCETIKKFLERQMREEVSG